MNRKDLLERFGDSLRGVESKKEQTTKKIEYVSTYLREWARVMCGYNKVDALVFVDCMCNAGIYDDGDLGKISRACALFCELAPRYPNKHFQLYANDKDADRVRTCNVICQEIMKEAGNPKNVGLLTAEMDVEEYLPLIGKVERLKKFETALLLFADPYNARVSLSLLTDFLMTHYCELIYNCFTSDVRRNVSDPVIAEKFGVTLQKGQSIDPIVEKGLRVNKICYVFSYSFRIRNGAELYKIYFATPNIKGLEKLKDVLWKVFEGSLYHQNTKVDTQAGEQLSLFGQSENEEMNASAFAADACHLIERDCAGKLFSYDEIERVLLERTMLREGQIVSLVLKPMVKDGRLIKCNRNVSPQNYKKDFYRVPESSDREAL